MNSLSKYIQSLYFSKEINIDSSKENEQQTLVILDIENSDNIIVNLPHLILNNIISLLEDNIDRVFFSLVCKRFYNERDKYLVFSHNFLYYSYQYKLQFKFNSYSKQISQLPLQIHRPFKKQETFFYYINTNNDDIPDEITKLYLKYCPEKHYIPNEIEIDFSNHIREITISDICDFNLSLLSPCTNLYSLSLYNFNLEIQAGQLPHSLKVLKFSSEYQRPIKPGVLPPNLETLFLATSYYHEIQNVPPTVSRITIRSDMIKHLDINNADLMVSYMELHIKEENVNFSQIPRKSIKELKLHFNNFVRKDDIESNILAGMDKLEKLTIETYGNLILLTKPLNQSLKWLKLDGKVDIDTTKLKRLPTNIEFLDFGNTFNQPIPPGLIPNNLKELKFGHCFNHPLRVGDIPNGVEIIDFRKYAKPLIPNALPPSVKKINAVKEFYKVNDLSLVAPLVSIISVGFKTIRRLDSNHFVEMYRGGIINQIDAQSYLSK